MEAELQVSVVVVLRKRIKIKLDKLVEKCQNKKLANLVVPDDQWRSWWSEYIWLLLDENLSGWGRRWRSEVTNGNLLLIDKLLIGLFAYDLRIGIVVDGIVRDWYDTTEVERLVFVRPYAALAIHRDLFGLVHIDGHARAEYGSLDLAQHVAVARHPGSATVDWRSCRAAYATATATWSHRGRH